MTLPRRLPRLVQIKLRFLMTSPPVSISSRRKTSFLVSGQSNYPQQLELPLLLDWQVRLQELLRAELSHLGRSPVFWDLHLELTKLSTTQWPTVPRQVRHSLRPVLVYSLELLKLSLSHVSWTVWTLPLVVRFRVVSTRFSHKS